MGAVSVGLHRGIKSALNPPRFGDELASKSLQNRPRSNHDQATIAPRSDHDRASIVILDLSRPPSDPVESIPRRQLHDCGSIVPRSRFDRTAIVEFFHDPSKPSDRDAIPLPAVRLMKIAIVSR